MKEEIYFEIITAILQDGWPSDNSRYNLHDHRGCRLQYSTWFTGDQLTDQMLLTVENSYRDILMTIHQVKVPKCMLSERNVVIYDRFCFPNRLLLFQWRCTAAHSCQKSNFRFRVDFQFCFFLQSFGLSLSSFVCLRLFVGFLSFLIYFLPSLL